MYDNRRWIALLPGLLLAPGAAASPAATPPIVLAQADAASSLHRVLLEDGTVLEGRIRFEGEEVVVVGADGSETRVPRSSVARIDLAEPPATPRGFPEGPRPPPAPLPPEEPAPPPRQEEPRGQERTGPSYPRYVPPPLPPPAPAVGRQMFEKVGFRNGLALSLGYKRGLGVGAEWQQRVARYVGLGLGAQGGLASNEDVTCGTFGATGRLYVGNEHRFVTEAGFGLNRIDPYLERGNRTPSCGRAEKNYGPEASVGYQFVSSRGFLAEALGGMVFVVNDELADAHESIAPAFQVSFGFVFR